jgi:hypothetical protein
MKVVTKSTITPNPPKLKAEYPSGLLFAISDIPPKLAPIIRSIVTKSYDAHLLIFYNCYIQFQLTGSVNEFHGAPYL